MQFRSEAHFADKLSLYGQMVLLARTGMLELLMMAIM